MNLFGIHPHSDIDNSSSQWLKQLELFGGFSSVTTRTQTRLHSMIHMKSGTPGPNKLEIHHCENMC